MNLTDRIIVKAADWKLRQWAAKIKGGETLTNDQKTSIAGVVAALCGAIAVFFPQAGPIVQQLSGAIAAVAIALLGIWTNKPDAPKAP